MRTSHVGPWALQSIPSLRWACSIPNVILQHQTPCVKLHTFLGSYNSQSVMTRSHNGHGCVQTMRLQSCLVALLSCHVAAQVTLRLTPGNTCLVSAVVLCTTRNAGFLSMQIHIYKCRRHPS